MKLIIDTFNYTQSDVLFAHIADKPWSLFYDSGFILGEKISKNATNDVLCMLPIKTLISELIDTDASRVRTKIESWDHDEVSSTKISEDSPWALLKSELPKENTNSLAYLPGAYGYLSYDIANEIASLPALKNNDMPVMAIGIFYTVLVIDHDKKNTRVISLDSDKAISTHKQWCSLIKKVHSGALAKKRAPLKPQGDMQYVSFDDYAHQFAKVKKYLQQGDCYQVNLTQPFSVPVKGDPYATYQRLRKLSPAPFGAFLQLPFATIISNSPEGFLSCRGRTVTTNPIKGTAVRYINDEVKDKYSAQSLLSSEKDKAENVMIVDLLRNDLSQSCVAHSVKATTLFSLQSFQNVHHLVSTIQAKIEKNTHTLEVLRRCFPGGSITGAPKIRAMQIIAELEKSYRGVYCGSVLYTGCDGDLMSSIAIRTMTIRDDMAYFSAGGAIVIDSEVHAEYKEIQDKVSMLLAALGVTKKNNAHIKLDKHYEKE